MLISLPVTVLAFFFPCSEMTFFYINQPQTNNMSTQEPANAGHQNAQFGTSFQTEGHSYL